MGSNVVGTDSMSENVAEMSICSEPMFSYGWDANPHYPAMLENQIPFSTSDSCLLVDMMPKIPCFETGDFSEDAVDFSLLNGRRKRKNLEVEKPNDHENMGTCEFPKEDEKKNTLPSSRSKRQGKASSNGEDYILVRAKRGQATNSHSLAERVRREKISERMKLLQDLVPGCNKITGKAVMLDEIINYVQSLQQQVEFLSMKLATVNPDIDVDIDHLLLKDLLLHPQGGNVTGPGLSSSHAFLHGFQHGSINGFQVTPPPLHPLPTKFCNNELQNVLQMGFDSNPSSSNISGANGFSKMEM